MKCSRGPVPCGSALSSAQVLKCTVISQPHIQGRGAKKEAHPGPDDRDRVAGKRALALGGLGALGVQSAELSHPGPRTCEFSRLALGRCKRADCHWIGRPTACRRARRNNEPRPRAKPASAATPPSTASRPAQRARPRPTARPHLAALRRPLLFGGGFPGRILRLKRAVGDPPHPRGFVEGGCGLTTHT